jgi:hypothetical protein
MDGRYMEQCRERVDTDMRGYRGMEEAFFIRTTSVKSSDDGNMCVAGQYHTAVHIHKKLIKRFSDDPAHANQLAVTYLMINRLVSSP